MNLGKLGSCYIVGSEGTLCGNEIITRTYWKAPYSSSALLPSYEKLLEKHPQLRMRWSTEKLQWEPWEQVSFDALLEIERNKMQKYISEDDILNQFEPSSSSLPLRIRVSAPNEVIFIINHAFANGLSSTYWVSKWFEVYAEFIGFSQSPAKERFFSALSPDHALSNGFALSKRIAGVLWAAFYLLGFVLRLLRRRTVDLTLGKTPELQNKYCTKTYLLDVDTTTKLIQYAKRSGLSVGEILCSELIRSLFQEQPDRDRICFSIPADLRNTLTHVPLDTPGNFTCSLIAQTFRDEDPDDSIQKIYLWLRRNVQFGIARVFGWLANNPLKLVEHFNHQTRKAIPERAPFENFTFAFSNLGLIHEPLMEHFIERMSLFTKTQTLFVGVFTFAGRLSIDSCISTHLFPQEASFLILERGIQSLILRLKSD